MKYRKMTKAQLIERIDGLERDLANATYDLNVYKWKIQKGMTHVIPSEEFLFSPEEARESFKVIRGGVA